MTTPPSALTVDAAQPQELARFWAGLLGWHLATPAEFAGGPDAAAVRPGRSVGGLAYAAGEERLLGLDEAPASPGAAVGAGLGRFTRQEAPSVAAPVVRPPAEDGCEFDLVFVAEAEPKGHKNRLHLDLASRTPEHQREVVECASALGARHLNLGQGDVPWVVLADPQDNEFCVLEPRPEYAGAGALAALVVDTNEPARLAGFWSVLTGWPVSTDQNPQTVGLRSPSGRGPAIEFVRSTNAKQGRNRLRLELAADPGADPLSPTQDPEGNEFCVRTRPEPA
ncbi:VOC family protein [Amycolatopsis sp. NPDC023774]|uniref:VOC family protein n=1 Tax=Amycolatopsis sp. NPDC023774 TaxID=3155015 RepID=UPI0033CBB021